MHNWLHRIGALVLAAPLSFAGAASASIQHPAVVLEDPANYTPWLVPSAAIPRPKVDAIGQIGDTIYAAGLFDTVSRPGGAPALSVSNFVAFVANTGVFKTTVQPAFTDPNFDDQVWAVETFGNSVFVGGEFTTVNGITRKRLVKIDGATGAVDTAFNARFPGGIVWTLRMWTSPGGVPMLLVGGSMAGQLVALDPNTGANTGYINLGIADAIPGAAGIVGVHNMAIDPAGTKLVATGNFRTVSGQSRTRLFVANLGGPTATLDPWYYPGFAKPCRSTSRGLIPYLRGVDFSPDGSYFVVVSTGFVPLSAGDIWPFGSSPPHTVCDATARFNLSDATRPAWINYTGGDTLWSVAATGAAVYVQGHNRWLDNPFGRDSAGPGAVVRRGIGAIDPNSGRALPWDPPKPAQGGGKVFFATSTGLWVGSDSQRFNGEPRRGIAFVPLP
jgi:hypothetical protein